MGRLASAAVGVLLGTAVLAHHSNPDFLIDQSATVEGTIESIVFKQPHVVIGVRTAGDVLYTIEWQGPAVLSGRQYFTPVDVDTFRVGDFIVVTGCPPRDPSRHELVRLTQVVRPRDDWRWRQ